jgi:membrane protease YdiL (CAAX protease family)
MLIFGIFTASFGVLHAWLYEKSGTIWVPSILHGAFNGAAALPLMLCLANTGSFRLLGPAPNGIISGLPIMAAAAVLLLRGDKRQST